MSKQLLDFINARLDEDEAKAQAATAGPWRHNPDKHWRKPGTRSYEEAVLAGPAGQDAEYVAGTGESDDPQSMANAEHIAHHDPVRVLAEVQAKRRVLARHVLSPATGDPELPQDNVDDCQYDGDSWPCPDLLDLALPYSNHPDYDDSWQPA